MEEKREVKKETVQDRVMSWLNGRYEDTFSEPVPAGGYAGAVYRQYLVRAEKLDKTVTVEVYDPDGPREHIWDNYVGLRYDAKVRERLCGLLADCFDVPETDLAVFWKPSSVGLADHWSMQTTVEEYMADPEAEISVTAAVRTDVTGRDSELLSRRFRETAEKSGVCFSGWVYFVPAGTDLSALDPVSLYEEFIFPERYSLRLYFLMRGPGDLSDLLWSVPAKDHE